MLSKISFCDVMLILKLIMGIALISIGIYNKEWFGLIGLWPIYEFINVLFIKKNTACSYKPKKKS